jgi:hypothetical protein
MPVSFVLLRLTTTSIGQHILLIVDRSVLVLWNSMHARAEEPAGANEARPDSPIDMHRDNSQAHAQQTRPGGSEASESGAEPCAVPAAPIQQAAQLMGRRLKVRLSFTRLPRSVSWVVRSAIDM